MLQWCQSFCLQLCDVAAHCWLRWHCIAFIYLYPLNDQCEQQHCHVAARRCTERGILSTPWQKDFSGWWMDRCQARPKMRPQSSARQINLKQTLIGCRVIIMTGGLEPKAGGCGAAHPRGVMCLWLTVNPSCLVDRRSSTVRSTHHCDSYCSSDLGLHQEGCTHFLRNFYKCKQLIQSN